MENKEKQEAGAEVVEEKCTRQYLKNVMHGYGQNDNARGYVEKISRCNLSI